MRRDTDRPARTLARSVAPRSVPAGRRRRGRGAPSRRQPRRSRWRSRPSMGWRCRRAAPRGAGNPDRRRGRYARGDRRPPDSDGRERPRRRRSARRPLHRPGADRAAARLARGLCGWSRGARCLRANQPRARRSPNCRRATRTRCWPTWSAMSRPASSPNAATFFTLVRSHTIQGTFCDPYYGGNADFVGWDLIGYPGLRMAVGAGGPAHGGAEGGARLGL